MPLSGTVINNELVKLLDKNAVGFVGFGTNPLQVATKWSDVVNTYASAVIPISTTSVAAKAAFIAALTPGVAPGAFMPALASAFTAYALALAGGMAGAGFVGTPPPSPIVLPPFPATTATTASAVAASWGTIIDTWFKTGTATPIIGGATITWS